MPPRYPLALKCVNNFTARLAKLSSSMNVTPHVAARAKGSAIDGRTTRHAGYGISQRIRKRIEEAFGWSRTVGLAAKTMLRGVERIGTQFTLTLAAYNLVRLPKLLRA